MISSEEDDQRGYAGASHRRADGETGTRHREVPGEVGPITAAAAPFSGKVCTWASGSSLRAVADQDDAADRGRE